MVANVIMASAADQGESAVERWLDAIALRAIDAGLIALGAVIVIFLGRLVISALTRSIAAGSALSPKARRALEKARLDVGSRDPVEARLQAERRRQRARTIRTVLNSTLVAVVLATAVLMLLEIAGVPVAPLLASAGIAGVALGFGAQSLVKDVLAGVFMLVEDQYGVGDIVDLGEASGSVEDVGLRVTRLRSLDGTVWFVPNGAIVRVGNMTKVYSRALVEVRLSYDTDLEVAKQAMLDAVAAARASDPEVDAAILAEPEVPGIEAFDYDALVLRVLVQVAPTSQWNVMRAIRREMRTIFAQRGVAMAVPDHTLYLDNSHPAKRGAVGGETTSPATEEL